MIQFKENRNRQNELVGYWDEDGKARLLSEVFTKDEHGNITDILRDDVEIIQFTQQELDEAIAKSAEHEANLIANQYKIEREREYPPITDYLDGVVKGDQAQIDAYISACQAVKAKYPKS